MSQNQGRVTPIKTKADGQAGDEGAPKTDATNDLDARRDGLDLSKIAIVVSLLSVVLTVIFFFGLNRNLSGLSNEVRDIGVIRSNVSALDAYVDDLLDHRGQVNTQIAKLKADRRTDAIMVLQESMIDDMLRQTAFMNEQLAAIESEDADRVAKLSQVRRLLQDLRDAGPAAPSQQTAPEQPERSPGQSSAPGEETAPAQEHEPVLQ